MTKGAWTVNDGGPAFPNPETEQYPAEKGMSLRAWLAGQAIAGLVQFADAPTKLKPAEMAEAACNIADAVIKRLSAS